MIWAAKNRTDLQKSSLQKPCDLHMGAWSQRSEGKQYIYKNEEGQVCPSCCLWPERAVRCHREILRQIWTKERGHTHTPALLAHCVLFWLFPGPVGDIWRRIHCCFSRISVRNVMNNHLFTTRAFPLLVPWSLWLLLFQMLVAKIKVWCSIFFVISNIHMMQSIKLTIYTVVK